ncbi:alpha-L-fucosidase [Sphingobacterium sp. UT-1RO-CII-1]|uniref:alpha-L-fucosidase n=1 Tax=Sphingobacterium sp. UT-1RO-CII-1 TaxID=2995225 RepID=UPI00227A6744|nr:alpha-L-fucosidase [Sphingobacterium sp. UT-1RO-CII-1]MCY4781495.1 alpha-L-fucosidase [Sphingobacterium sp. UT-1RO-CII-1]
MKIKNSLLLSLLLASFTNGVSAQTTTELPISEKMEWFDDAKLGIFIHWGIYAVDGLSESWSFFNNYTSHENYLKQLNGFTAENYQPQDWVKLIKEAGAKYAVITSKHHDGVSLWDSQAAEALTTVRHTAAKRDVLTPFIEELKKTGLKTGLYYSLPDWSHPYYDIKTRVRKRYELAAEPKLWNKYVHYYQQQLEELSQQYSPDLLWFDGDWEHSATEWEATGTMKLLRNYNPNIIVNSRLHGQGDYETPEQGIPVVKPASRYWELCYTMNDSWGYQPFDKHYKTPNMIVRTLVDCIAMGGNLLLDIGPKADGSIPSEQVAILKELKRWTGKYHEAIYGTKAGVEDKYLRDKNAFSKDGKTLFIYLDEVKSSLDIAGLHTKPESVRLVANNKKIDFTHSEGNLRAFLDQADFDLAVTVVAVDFKEKPNFTLDKKSEQPTLLRLAQKGTDEEQIDYLVKWTDYGSNLFAEKLSVDAEYLDESIVFESSNVKDWVRKHAEVLSYANPGMEDGHYAGYSALSEDKQTLYLFVKGKPTGPIAVKGLKNTIARIRIVGEGSMIEHSIYNKLYWSSTPGIVYIDIPESRLDENVTVIAVLLDKPIDLYREEVKAIESNL